MRASLVSEKHINVLVNFARQLDICFWWLSDADCLNASLPEDCQRLVEILYQQNVTSVLTYFNEAVPNAILIYYDSPKFYPISESSPVQIIKACECYDYNAGCTDDYTKTDAADIVRRIKNIAIRQLPGHREAAWEIV